MTTAEPRNVAPQDRIVSVTMTAGDWEVVLFLVGRQPGASMGHVQTSDVAIILNKLESQIGARL